jgi:hypothetical protein
LRAQHLKQGGGGQAADGELGGPVDEAARVVFRKSRRGRFIEGIV